MSTFAKGMAVLVVLAWAASVASAEDWGRYYHYPYSYYPQNYLRPFRSQDFNGKYGYPMYPAYMAFPPYFRRDLYYPYLNNLKPGNNPCKYYQGNHHVLDVF